ncbi:MAG: hypothetical protein WKF88_04800 [Ferruginibacter sp.]
MIKIRKENFLYDHYATLNKKESLRTEDFPVFIMKCFSNLLNSYTKSFNKVYNRKGSLFIDYLRRVHIEDDAQFGATAFYIHKNPVHHGYCKRPEEWEWSSYHSYLHKTPTQPAGIHLMEWFGGLEGFIKYHQQEIYLKGSENIE